MTNTTPTNASTEQNAKPKGAQSMAKLDLRDYFAAAALPEAIQQAASVMDLSHAPDPRANAARIAYECADAMIARRNQEGA